MAEENNESKIGFDAREALAMLAKLNRAFSKFSQELNEAAAAAGGLNASQEQVDDVLKRVSTMAQLASGHFKDLAKNQKAAAKAAGDMLRSQKKADRLRIGQESRENLEGKFLAGMRDRATLKEVVVLDKSLDTFKKVVAGTKLSAAEVDVILENLGDSYTGAARRVRDAAVTFLNANAKLGATNVKATAQVLAAANGGSKPPKDSSTLTKDDKKAASSSLRDKLVQADAAARRAAESLRAMEQSLRDSFRGSKELAEGVGEVEDKSKNLEISWQSIAKIALTQLATQGIQQAIGFFTDGIRAAREYELQLAAIQTISKTFAAGGLDSVADEISKISTAFGLPLEDVARGLYETMSNQIGTAAESTQFLGVAAEFSKASLTSLADSVDLLSSVLNSYGLNAAAAENISGKLFKVIDLGRVKGEELANTIGRVLPLASELGVSFDEVAAGIAHLTIQGVKASEAYTLMSNVLLKLIRPTKALKNEFTSLGVSSVELAIMADGLQGFLKRVSGPTGTTASEIGDLFNQVRGIRGVLAITGKTGEDFTKTLEKIKEASADVTEQGAAIIQKTPAAQLQKEFADARDFLVNDFGRSVNKVLAQLVQAIGGARVAVQTFGSVLAGVGFVGAVIGTKLLWAAIAANPLVATIALVGTAASALANYGNSARDAAKDMEAFNIENERLRLEAKVTQKALIADRIKALSETAKGLDNVFTQMQKAYNEDKDAAITVQDATNASLNRQLNKRVSLLQSFLGTLQNIQSQAKNSIKSLGDETLNLKFEAGQSRFERGIAGLDSAKQSEALATRSIQVLNAAKEAASKGNNDFANQLFASASELANRAASTDASNEGFVNKVLQERISFNETLIRQEKKKAEQAARLFEKNEAIAAEVDQAVNELQSLKLLEKGGDTSRDQLKKIAERRQELLRTIDSKLGQVTAGGLEIVVDTVSLKSQIREIASGATDPLTGTVTSFEKAFDTAGVAILTKLTASMSKIPVEFQATFKTASGREFDPFAGPGSISQGTGQRLGEVRTDIENGAALPDLNSFVRESQKVINEQFKAVFLSINKARTDETDPNALAQLAQRERDTRNLQSRVSTVIATADPDALRQLGVEIQQLQTQADLATGVMKEWVAWAYPAQQSSDTRVNIATAEAFAKISAELPKAVENVKAFNDQMKIEVNVDPALRSIQAIPEAWRQAGIEMENEVPTVRVQREAFLPQFAKGGSFGPDLVNARLTPGETVMNPLASRTFRSQLKAMNRGLTPQFAEGGEVTNNQFGDIKINIGKDAAKTVDGRQLARQLRRELRKKTVKR